MKKQIVLPLLAVVLAVSGAFASNRLMITYYDSADTFCSNPIEQLECTPGDGAICVDPSTSQTFKYSDPATSVVCEQLRRESQK